MAIAELNTGIQLVETSNELKKQFERAGMGSSYFESLWYSVVVAINELEESIESIESDIEDIQTSITDIEARLDAGGL